MLQGLKDRLLPAGESIARIGAGPMRGVVVKTSRRHSLQLLYGLWERETYAFIRKASGRCDWAIDVGAGAGELPIHLALSTRMRPIFAIDASERMTDRIAENAALNRVGDAVTIRTAFVGAPGQELDALPVRRDQRGFIKIDVDGGEMDVLRSGSALLEGANDLLVETHSLALEQACQAFLAGLGYAVTIIPNAWWRTAIPERRVGHNRWLSAERPT